MTDREIVFLRELKELLDRHQVRFARDAVYYPDDASPRFVFPEEPGATVVTIDDMADLRGGWKHHWEISQHNPS